MAVPMDVSMHPSIMSSAWPYVNTLRIMHAFNVQHAHACDECIIVYSRVGRYLIYYMSICNT